MGRRPNLALLERIRALAVAGRSRRDTAHELRMSDGAVGSVVRRTLKSDAPIRFRGKPRGHVIPPEILAARIDAVRHLAESGLSREETARRLHLTVHQVKLTASISRIPFRPSGGPHPKSVVRRQPTEQSDHWIFTGRIRTCTRCLRRQFLSVDRYGSQSWLGDQCRCPNRQQKTRPKPG